MIKRRKSKVTPPPPGCPLRRCMALIAGAWTPDIVWYLRSGERTFSELESDLTGISAKMLTSRLRKLEQDRVLRRIPKKTSPPTVSYQLTGLGEELVSALSVIVDIGHRLKESAGKDGEISGSEASHSAGHSSEDVVMPFTLSDRAAGRE